MNNGDTLFNWIQSVNSRQRSTTAGLLAIGLVMSALLISPRHALASNEDPTLDLVAPTEVELYYLTHTFRGFVAIAFPSDPVSKCEVHEATPYQRRWKEFYRSWFSIAVEARCPGVGPIRDEIWIQCTKRSSDIDCTIATPSENVLAAIESAAKRDAAAAAK